MLYIDLADLYRADGQAENARDCYKRALTISPDSDAAKVGLKSLHQP
jgi:cytochrome c-type biogenesis protein CcmH/NrfG